MIRKQFWRYVLPSMIAFAFSGIYAIVDGFFVGRSLGDAGLASINIAYPLQAKAVLKMAYQTAFGITIVCMFGLYILRTTVPLLFGVSPETLFMYKEVILYFIVGLLFTAFLRITTSYFYAIRMNKSAYILIYGEPILLALLVGLILPKLIGLNGVWLAVPFTQVCLTFIGYILMKRRTQSLL